MPEGKVLLQDHIRSTAVGDTKTTGSSHYKKLKIEPIEYIEENVLHFHEGEIVKYITRWRDKGGIKDLEKVEWYVHRLMEREQARLALVEAESINIMQQAGIMSEEEVRMSEEEVRMKNGLGPSDPVLHVLWEVQVGVITREAARDLLESVLGTPPDVITLSPQDYQQMKTRLAIVVGTLEEISDDHIEDMSWQDIQKIAQKALARFKVAL